MIIREYLARRKSRFAYWSIASFVVLMAAIVVGVLLEDPRMHLVALGAFISYSLATYFDKYRVRCPTCGGNIGRHTSYFGLRAVRFFDTVNHCLFCGVKLDNQLAPNDSSKPTADAAA